MTQYYIHAHDPSFFSAPWPGVRRLGPFASKQEALEQAASDVAIGAGAGCMGIWSEGASEKLRDVAPNTNGETEEDWARLQANVSSAYESVPPSVTLEQIQERATKISEALTNAAAASPGLDEMKALIGETLPPDARTEETIVAVMRAARLIV